MPPSSASSWAPHHIKLFIDHPLVKVIRPMLMHPEIRIDGTQWVKSLPVIFPNAMGFSPEVVMLLPKSLRRY